MIHGFVDLIARTNKRGLFSGGPDSPLFYIVLSILGLALVAYFFVTSPPERLRPHLGLGMLAGGALGNLIDRLCLGVVRDMIDAHWLDWAHWPTFNIADSAICIGIGLLLLEAFWPQAKGGAAKTAEQAKPGKLDRTLQTPVRKA